MAEEREILNADFEQLASENDEQLLAGEQMEEVWELQEEIRRMQAEGYDLTSRDGNTALMMCMMKDRELIKRMPHNNCQIVRNSCELGKSLSSLVHQKAKKLNAHTLQPIVSQILHLYVSYTSSAGDRDAEISSYSSSNFRYMASNNPTSALDFKKISLALGNVIRLYPLTMSTNNFRLSNTERILNINDSLTKKRTRTAQQILPQCVCLPENNPKNSDTIGKQNGRTGIEAEQMLKKLLILTKQKPVCFWEFVLDARGMKGFNNTCRNLFLMTVLACRKLVSFSINSQGLLQVQATNAKNGEEFVECEGMISSWGFDLWRDLCVAFNYSSEKIPMFETDNCEDWDSLTEHSSNYEIFE